MPRQLESRRKNTEAQSGSGGSAQRIAAENPNVTAHVYDIRHFEKLKNQYNAISVPCLVVNDEKISFGKKNADQMLDFLREE